MFCIRKVNDISKNSVTNSFRFQNHVKIMKERIIWEKNLFISFKIIQLRKNMKKNMKNFHYK